MENTIYEMKNTLKVINRRLDEAEDPMRNLVDKITVSSQAEHQKEIRIF